MNNVADKLYNILGTKFNNTTIKTLDSTGKETTDMEEIEMFSFDFIVDNRNYGPVVILLSAEDNLEVYYGDNTSKVQEPEAKKKWENLIEHLSTFARGNRLGFSLKHTTDLKYDLSNITDITESYRNIFEGYYGTRKTSYSPQGKAKIIIRHSKAIGEDDKRFRNISQIFIENADGERFKLPFKKLTGARAMARHVTEGGNPYDLFGLHISEMVKDINTLGGFVRRSKMYEGDDDAMAMVETGRTHYQSMRKGLNQIAGKRGYHTYKESWEPSAITEQDLDTDKIRSLFTEKKVNPRTEDALPLLAKLQQMAEEQQLGEKAPPGMEDWIKDRKADFKDQYGDKWEEVLYATAWKQHNANESQELNELTELSYRGFTVEINPYKKGFAARARNRGGNVIATAPGKTEEEAFDAVKPKVDELVSTQKKVTGRATLDFNADFTQHLLKGGEDEIWVKVEKGPTLVIADGEMLDAGPEVLRGYGFAKSAKRNPKASEASTLMLGAPLSAKQASDAGVIANGRYIIADVTKDEDGNRVYELHYDSTVAATGEKFRMGVPAVTVGTERSLGEAGIEWPEEVKSDEFPGDAHPDQDDWGDDMEEIKEFEQWADGIVEGEKIVEGVWSVPDTPKKVKELIAFMSKPQPVGIDAINATDALYDILGSDDLFDDLGDLASKDPEADARPAIINWIKQAIKDGGFVNPKVPRFLRRVINSLSIGEGFESDLDADDETQLNASANRDMDAHKLHNENEDENMKPYSEYVAEAEAEEIDETVEEVAEDDEVVDEAEEKEESKKPWEKDDDKEEISESAETDLKGLMERTNFLLRK